MLEKNYEIRYSDLKNFDSLKVSALLNIIEDVSISDSEIGGFSLEKLRSMNIAWLIRGISLDILKKPVLKNSITAFTAVKNSKGTVSERCTVLKQNGEITAKAVVSWFTFDTELMRPCRIPKEISDAYGIYDFGSDFPDYKKPELCQADEILQITVGNKEIDTNGHLNNVKSAEILMDALPFDFEFSHLNVYYKKAAYSGDVLKLCRAETENGYFACLTDRNGDLFVAGAFEK